MRLPLSFVFAVFLLSACQTVQDQSIPLGQEFSQDAIQFNVKRPTSQISDSVYQQQLQSTNQTYDITGTETGWGRSEQSQHWFSESGNLINGIELKDKYLRIIFLDLLGMRNKSSHHYLLKAENDFAFVVNANRPDTVQVRCRILFLNQQTDTTYQMSGNKQQRHEDSTRLNSYLGCNLQAGSQQWYLTVDTLQNETPTIKMLSAGQSTEGSFQFNHVKETSYLVGGKVRTLPNNFYQFSGLDVQLNNQSVAALSFEGHNPKIWLAGQTQPEQKSVLLAMSYSLLMYDWLDGGWRSKHSL